MSQAFRPTVTLCEGATKAHGTCARGGRGGEERKADEVSAATRNAAVSESKCRSALHTYIVGRQLVQELH